MTPCTVQAIRWKTGAARRENGQLSSLSLLATPSTENVCHITLMDLHDASDFFALHSGDYAFGSIYSAAGHIR